MSDEANGRTSTGRMPLFSITTSESTCVTFTIRPKCLTSCSLIYFANKKKSLFAALPSSRRLPLLFTYLFLFFISSSIHSIDDKNTQYKRIICTDGVIQQSPPPSWRYNMLQRCNVVNLLANFLFVELQFTCRNIRSANKDSIRFPPSNSLLVHIK